MKAWWKIHDKPRGRWYPLLEWGVTFTSSEMEEMEALNVKASLRYCFKGGGKPHPSCTGQYGERVMAFFPASRVFCLNSARVGAADVFGRAGSCASCPDRSAEWYHFETIEIDRGGRLVWGFRLPWRPGARPDYSDFIDPTREFLFRVIEEFESRFDEARESAPSDEWLLEEEFDSFFQPEGVESAEKKIRVIRR